VVRLGLFTLLVLGLLTVFGESLLAALFPGGDAPAGPSATPPAQQSNR
jgi:hypothetical protein